MRVTKRSRQKECLGQERIDNLTDYAGDSPRPRPSQPPALSQRSYLTVSSRLEELTTVQQWFQNLINRFSHTLTESVWVGESFDQLNLAIAEGFTNAVRHAHADLPSATPILIECEVRAHQVDIYIFDQGEPFNPDSLVEPQPGTLREGGYGWFLLRRLADEVTYSPAQREVLLKRLSEAESGHSIDSYTAPKSEDIERICNCLKLIKKA